MSKIRIASALVAAAAAVSLAAPAAQAATVERFDRSAFDSAPVVTASGYSMSGDTRGELGGHLELVDSAGRAVASHPPGWDTLDLIDGLGHRVPLVRAHVEALWVRTWLAVEP